MRRTVPMGRLGTAEDCVGAYLFLASELLSGYVIGQIIEVNGGRLSVESLPGQGTTFVIEFPLHTATRQDAAA